MISFVKTDLLRHKCVFHRKNSNKTVHTMSQETAQSSTSCAKVSDALKVLGQLCEKREEKQAGMPTDAIHEESDDDDENGSSSPIFDRFYANGGLVEISK